MTPDTTSLLRGWEAYMRARGRSPRTVDAYATDAARLCAFLAARDTDLARCATADVAAWAHALHAAGFAPASVLRKLAVARGIAAWLVATGLRPDDPACGVILPGRSRGVAAGPDVPVADLLRAVADAPGAPARRARDACLVGVLVETGATVSELCAMRVGDVDAADGFARVASPALRLRVLPLSRRLADDVAAYVASVRPAWVDLGSPDRDVLFLTERGGRFTRQGVWKLLRGYGARAGIAATPRALRRGFAQRQTRHGADAVAAKLGVQLDTAGRYV